MNALRQVAIVFAITALSGIPFERAYALVRDIQFPVQGSYAYRDDFAEPRAGGAREHLGIDILADKMTPVVAAVDGRISYLASPQASWGYSITIRDSEGYQYRYLHLNNDTPGTDDGVGGESHAYAEGLRRGSTVTKGQIIGWVGDSGNAESTSPHLHFEMRMPDRTAYNPYESLKAADSRSAPGSSIATSSTSGAVASSQYLFTKRLSRGQTGEGVRQLQVLLKELGFYDYPEITGYFGPVTEKAVIAFQKSVNIEAVGAVGPITRGILNAI